MSQLGHVVIPHAMFKRDHPCSRVPVARRCFLDVYRTMNSSAIQETRHLTGDIHEQTSAQCSVGCQVWLPYRNAKLELRARGISCERFSSSDLVQSVLFQPAPRVAMHDLPGLGTARPQTAGHSYHNINSSGNARVHVGDVHGT
jgi:hypothetical protein